MTPVPEYVLARRVLLDALTAGNATRRGRARRGSGRLLARR